MYILLVLGVGVGALFVISICIYVFVCFWMSVYFCVQIIRESVPVMCVSSQRAMLKFPKSGVRSMDIALHMQTIPLSLTSILS